MTAAQRKSRGARGEGQAARVAPLALSVPVWVWRAGRLWRRAERQSNRTRVRARAVGRGGPVMPQQVVSLHTILSMS